MSRVRFPVIVIVDDEVDEADVQRGALEGLARVVVRQPGDVSKSDLSRSDAILVDYRLDHWPERDVPGQLGLKPRDGVALSAVLRSQATDLRDGRPIAIALLSARLGELTFGLPVEASAPAVARSHNLEWIFTKVRPALGPDLGLQLQSLACAVRDLPERWPSDDYAQIALGVTSFLCLNKGHRWYQRAWEDLEDCHPPIHALSSAGHGLGILRWLLHRILPYPCFLIGPLNLAARLLVTPESLARALSTDDALSLRLRRVHYRGPLHGFAGERWWRAGIEHLLWPLTKGKPFEPDAVRTAARSLSPLLEPLGFDDPVVALNREFEADGVVASSVAVEIFPDDWPPYAEQCWVRAEDAAANPGLAMLRRAPSRAAPAQ